MFAIVELLWDTKRDNYDALEESFVQLIKAANVPLASSLSLPNSLSLLGLKSAKICDIINSQNDHRLYSNSVEYQLFSYYFSDIPPQIEDDSKGYRLNMLPSLNFDGVWENLVFENENIKSDLLSYIQTTLLFADSQINHNLINWNKIILFHGPPGTGKTSLCKGLSQKLAIRLQSQYPIIKFIEVNSANLFSKFFSESGKLVAELFEEITTLLDDNSIFICLLIDEVESLTSARKQALHSSEPSDAIRVVNTLLTSLDALKQRPNILILSTSNLSNSIDEAFVDRADLKVYLGKMGKKAIFEVLVGCLMELRKGGVLDWDGDLATDKMEDGASICGRLMEIADSCEGFSGRTLRKIPFLAHVYFANEDVIPINEFLTALEKTVQREKAASHSIISHMREE